MQSQALPPFQSGHYHREDNVQLHYLFWPNPDSRSCCLLLHGFTNDAHIWDSFAAKLQKYHNVIAPDFRGHGDSEWDNMARYTHDELVNDVYALMQQQDFQQWHVIGHSLGARVAMLMFARKQLQPASFVIIDTGPEVRAVGVDKVRQDAQNTPAYFSGIPEFEQYLSNIYMLAQPERIRQMAHYGLKQDARGNWIAKTDPAFTTALWKPDNYQGNSSDLRFPMHEELWLALAKIQAPTLILKGQASAILARQTAEKMAYQIMPNAQLEVIKRAGHALMVDNPDAFETTVENFLRSSTNQ